MRGIPFGPARSVVSSLRRRLLAGFGAGTFGRIFTTLIQVISVPVVLTHWGAPLYGEWILLNTIPSYFALSDVGFGSVAGNEMTMLVAADKRQEALEVFQSVWTLTTTISSFIGILLLIGIWIAPLDRWVHVRILSLHDVRVIVLFLGLSVLASMQETLFQAAFRCVGKFAFGSFAKSILVLFTFAATLVAIILGEPPVRVALIGLIVNGLATLILWRLLKREIPWIEFGVRHAKWNAIRRLASPAISYMSFPIGTALTLQGILVVIGFVMGPLAVVVFSTARTISRTANQVMQIINSSFWPEVSTAFGSRNIVLARKLHVASCQLSIFLCVSVAGFIGIFGNRVWKLWTVGKVVTDPILLDIMLLQLLISALWFTSSVVHLSINKHQGLAKINLVASCLSLFLAWVLMRIPSLGLRGAAAALTVGDLFTTVYVLRTSLRLLEETPREFLISMLKPPNVGNIFRRTTSK
jgi:O-antigen/teichoic acid export membrane protein